MGIFRVCVIHKFMFCEVSLKMALVMAMGAAMDGVTKDNPRKQINKLLINMGTT